ncbi:hypothetical protein B0H13DRAFT_2314749 [Mycena leptocephala]|nr:hypothetical protein B0H13DRAFT_2314749 [Mycena leptocephala]
MDPAIPISLSIGFSLRIFLLTFDRQSPLRPTFVGIWEGIALYRGLSTSGPQQIDSYLPCAFRLLVDFFFTENVHTMITLIFSLVLAFMISDVVNSYHGHDAQVNRRSSVKRKPGSPIGSAQIYEISDSPRLNRIRFISPMIKPGLPSPPVVQTMRPPNNRIVDFVVRADHIHAEDQPRSSSSHGPAHAPDSPSLVPTPITPPCTPPKRILPPHPREDIPTCNSGSPQDELQTPPLLMIPQL